MPEQSAIDVRRFVHNVALKRGWELNRDEEFLSSLIEGLEANLARLGYLQCPCRLSWDDRQRDRDIICPCDYAEADIAEHGHCFCSLFLSHAYAARGEEPTSIPERRAPERFP